MFKNESIHMKATGLVLGVVYLANSIAFFIEWTLYNPFSFVSKIPSMRPDQRGEILGTIVLFYLIAYIFLLIRKDFLPSESSNEKVDEDSGIESYDRSYSTITPISTRSGPDVVDIAVGVGLGLVGGNIVSDILDIGD